MIIVKSFKNNYLVEMVGEEDKFYFERMENGKMFSFGVVSEKQFEEICCLPTTKEHFVQHSADVQKYVLPLFQQYERKKKLEKLLQ